MFLGNLTDKQYNEVEAVRNSDLGKIKKSINHYLSTDKAEEKESFRIGRAFHCFLLEPAIFELEAVIIPDSFDKRSNERKAQWQAWEDAKMLIVKQSELDNFKRMKESLLAHPKIRNILENSSNEGAYTATIEGVECKAKVDIFNKGFIFDLKTTEDASPEAMSKFITNWDTSRQLTFYEDIVKANGIAVNGVGIIAVEKKAPFNVGVYAIDNATLDHGRAGYKKILKKLADYNDSLNTDSPVYGGYSTEIEVLVAKPWYFYEN